MPDMKPFAVLGAHNWGIFNQDFTTRTHNVIIYIHTHFQLDIHIHTQIRTELDICANKKENTIRDNYTDMQIG